MHYQVSQTRNSIFFGGLVDPVLYSLTLRTLWLFYLFTYVRYLYYSIHDNNEKLFTSLTLKAVEAVHWSCLSLAPSPGLLVRGLFLLVKEVAPNRNNPKKNTFFFFLGGGGHSGYSGLSKNSSYITIEGWIVHFVSLRCWCSQQKSTDQFFWLIH